MTTPDDDNKNPPASQDAGGSTSGDCEPDASGDNGRLSDPVVTRVADQIEKSIADTLRTELMQSDSSTGELFAGSANVQVIEKVARQARQQAMVAMFAMESHSGPLPAPRQMAHYERILPGTALAIRDEFQANGKHVRDMERLALTASIRRDDSNRIVAAFLVLVSFGLITLLAFHGHAGVAIALATVTVVPIIVAFITGRTKLSTSSAPDEDEE